MKKTKKQPGILLCLGASLFSGILLSFTLYMLIDAFIFPGHLFTLGWTLLGVTLAVFLRKKRRLKPYAAVIKRVFWLSFVCCLGLAFIVPSNSAVVNRPQVLMLKQDLRELDRLLQQDQAAGKDLPLSAQELKLRIDQLNLSAGDASLSGHLSQVTLKDPVEKTAETFTVEKEGEIIYAPQLNAQGKVMDYVLSGRTRYYKWVDYP